MNVLIERFIQQEKQATITGIIHVGTNDFHELQFYRQLGFKNVVGFEPLPSALAAFKKKYPKEEWDNVIPIALSDESMAFVSFHETTRDGQGSSLLLPNDDYLKQHPEYLTVRNHVVTVSRFDKWYDHDGSFFIEDYNCLVIDTQGTELQVLKGFGIYLHNIKYLVVECADKPNYIGQATFKEIDEYLTTRGFILDLLTDNDAFYIREEKK